MKNPNFSFVLTHPEASRERLLSMVRQVPGATEGVKIAALLLILEGQRPRWIAKVLGVTRQSVYLWMHHVNTHGLKAVSRRPGRPSRSPHKVRQELEAHLERSPIESVAGRVR